MNAAKDDLDIGIHSIKSYFYVFILTLSNPELITPSVRTMETVIPF
ncbi:MULTISPECIES: hypothetical protein [unclassified Lacrimispora]